MPTTEVWYSLVDYTDETSGFGLNFEPVQSDGSNYQNATGDGATDFPGQLRLTIGALTLGNYIQTAVTCRRTAYNATVPGNQYAQVEQKWLMTYRDNVLFDLHTFEIPCPNLSLLQANSDYLDKSHATVIAFIAAFELRVKSPAGNPVQFLTGRLVSAKRSRKGRKWRPRS